MAVRTAALFASAPLLILAAACSDPAPAASQTPAAAATAATTASYPQTPPATDASASAPAETAPAADVQPAPLDVPPIVESAQTAAKPIDTAEWKAEAVTPQAKKNALIRAEVLLARAHF